MTNLNEGFVFIVDTGQYAGNFEREMTAHITGKVGECGVGQEFADEEVAKMFPNVIDVPDDNGCYRPTTIFKDKDGSYNSVGIFFQEKPTQDQIEVLKNRSKGFLDVYRTTGAMAQFCKDDVIDILGFRIQEIAQNVKEQEV